MWDVVAAFGLANLGNTELNIGHHLSLPRSSLQYCFHAHGARRAAASFLPTRLHGACEVWFRGVHSDVGGGNGNRGLNDIALKWMMSKAKAAGLPITAGDIAALRPDPASPAHLDKELHLDVRLVSAVDRGHYTLSVSQGCTTLPGTCQIETAADEQIAHELGAETLEVSDAGSAPPCRGPLGGCCGRREPAGVSDRRRQRSVADAVSRSGPVDYQ